MSLPKLFEGRIVFLGDAGYCPSFLSGMGASLALLGAKILAKTLAEPGTDAPSAFVAYEKALRPVFEHLHRTARANFDNLLSRSRGRELIRNAIMRWLPPAIVARQVGKQFHSEGKLLEGTV